MRIQVFSQYYNLGQAGKVKPLACPFHKEDPDITYPLIPVEENEKVMLQCLACGSKIQAGQHLYQQILKEIQNA